MDTKQLKKYISSANVLHMVLGAFMVVFGGCFLVMLVPDTDEPVVALLMGLFIAAMGGVIIWAAFSNMRELNNQFRELENAGKLDRIVEEFNRAEVLVKDKVRLGQNYIFGKGSGRLVRYEEIRQVYQYIKKRNFVEVVRSLKYVDNQGKTRDLCQLQLRGKSDEDVKKIVVAILSKNPMVKIGYK